MSYILEALKKSDKERHQDTIPDLKADHSLPASRRQERKFSGWLRPGVLVLGVLCAGAYLWWQLSANQPVLVVETSEEIVPVVSDLEKTSQKAVAVKPVPKEQTKKKDSASVAESKQTVTVAPVAVETIPVSLLAKWEKEFLPPLMEDLPIAVRAGIPDLSFAGHVYSNAAPKRLIIINNRVVREGDLISNGLVLRQIDPDGVVLKYEESVFRVKLF
jgi:general secretion pathway protein B